MMMLEELITILLLWSVGGTIPCVLWAMAVDPAGWELCNPYWAYKYHRSVNWFGAILLSLVYAALCPIGALIYWLYKLCTVGRKNDYLQ